MRRDSNEERNTTAASSSPTNETAKTPEAGTRTGDASAAPSNGDGRGGASHLEPADKAGQRSPVGWPTTDSDRDSHRASGDDSPETTKPANQSDRPSRSGPTSSQRIARGVVQAVLFIALVGGGLYAARWFNTTAGKAERSAGEQSEASRLVDVAVARRTDANVRVRAMGAVRPAREAVVRPRVAGMIVDQSPSFVPGGFFDAGEFMLQIERDDYEQSLVQREAELARAEADLQIELGDQAVAEEELELLEIDIPEINRDLILRIPQVNQARAAVRSAEASVRAATLDLRRTTIAAPFSGHLVSREASIGNNVSEGERLATLVGADEYWIELTVPLASLRWIEPASAERPGSAAMVTDRRAWPPGATRQGRVTQLIGELEQGTRLARLIVTVRDPLARENPQAPSLIVDAFVEVVISGRVLDDVVVLDRDLVRENDTVWVMGDDDRLITKSVEIAYRGRDEVYVTAGLEDADRVVVTNLTAPVDGMLLRENQRVDPAGGTNDEADAQAASPAAAADPRAPASSPTDRGGNTGVRRG